MLKIDTPTRSKLYLRILNTLQPDPNPTKSQDVKAHAFAELFLHWNLPRKWTVGRVLTLAEWIESHVIDQMAEQEADAILICPDSTYEIEEEVGEEVAVKAFALAGLFWVPGGYLYGDATDTPRAMGSIPAYQPN